MARAILLAATVALVAACGPDPEPTPSAPLSGPADASAPASPSAEPTGESESASSTTEPLEVTGIDVGESIGGFDRPWDLRFLPDGTPLVTERPGRVVAVVGGERVVVDDLPGVVAEGEGGLMGLAIDPEFDANRRIYVCFSAGSNGRVDEVRVERFRLSEELDALTDRTPVVTDIPAGVGYRHQGCRLEIGPDGMLWITAGDGVQPSAPQDPDNRAGKVLRATLAGDPAPDNPGGDWDPYVYTMGHRNVQGLAFRALDGQPFSVEHGTSCDDEINVLTAGANYGWDPGGSGGGYAEEAPMTSSDVDDAVAAIWSSGCPTIAPSGADFITGQRWGTWVGRLVVAVLKDEELLVATIDGDEVIDTETYLTGDLGRLRTVRNAPDGSLWVTQDASPGSLVQLEPRS